MILAIYGGGGVGREILSLAEDVLRVEPRWRKIIFVDDVLSADTLKGKDLYTYEQAVKLFSPGDTGFIIGIGEPAARSELSKKIARDGYRLNSLKHPTAYVSPAVKIGEGVVVYPGTFIAPDVSIGNNVLLMANVTIGHDCVIGNHCVCAGQVSMGGGCRVGDCSYLGLSAVLRERVQVGAGSVVGMGSLVLKDVPGGVVAYGQPAAKVRSNIGGRVFKP